MSTPSPFGGGNPFEGIPIFGDLARLFTSQGPVNWDVARQIGGWVANEGKPEGNVDPPLRIRLEELARVADLHVADASGLSTSTTGRGVTVRPAGRAETALTTLDAYRPLLERLAASLGTVTIGDLDEPGEPGDPGGPDAAGPGADLMGSLAQIMSPMLLGVQSGFMVGYLARQMLDQYDLPIPRRPSDELILVAPNVDSFAEDWSLPADDVRLWVCLHAVAHHAVMGRPHVRARLEQLLGDYVSGFRPDAGSLEARLGSLDPADPTSWQEAMGDPEALLGAMQTDEQRQLLPRLEALTAAIEGYVDHVMDVVGHRLVGSYGQLTEAMRRRRVERGEGTRFVEHIFGLELSQRHFDRGAAFVRGVVERAGDAGLSRLWHSERELPTPAEIDAPGLWLERIDLPDEPNWRQ